MEEYEEVEEYIEEWVDYGQGALARQMEYMDNYDSENVTDPIAEWFAQVDIFGSVDTAIERVRVGTTRIVTISRTISILSTVHTCSAPEVPPPTELPPDFDPNLA